MADLEEKRKELNRLINSDAKYENILKVSIELDKLIEKYYLNKNSISQ